MIGIKQNLNYSGTLNRSGMVEQFEAMKEDYDALRQRYAELMASHAGTVHQLELAKVTNSVIATVNKTMLLKFP